MDTMDIWMCLSSRAQSQGNRTSLANDVFVADTLTLQRVTPIGRMVGQSETSYAAHLYRRNKVSPEATLSSNLGGAVQCEQRENAIRLCLGTLKGNSKCLLHRNGPAHTHPIRSSRGRIAASIHIRLK